MELTLSTGLILTPSQKCTRCNKYLPIERFEPRKRDGSLCAWCDSCRAKKLANMDKNKCEHGRRKYNCKDCQGTGICIHGKHKSICHECVGSQICPHRRVRAQCRDCCGSSFCEHGKMRCRCVECGGNSICEHGRVKIECKECKGSQICEHERKKSRCKDCNGASICEHDRISLSAVNVKEVRFVTMIQGELRVKNVKVALFVHMET